MATEAEIAVKAESFALGTVFTHHPGVVIELQRIIPTKEEIVPYFWVRNIDAGKLELAFDTHAAVRNVHHIDSVGDDHLCRVEWISEKDGLLTGLVETKTSLMSAIGNKDEWVFEVRVDDRSDLQVLLEKWQEMGITAQIRSLSNIHPIDAKAEHELTEPQREALDLALSRGYFEVPRKVTLEEIADELAISRQAFSSRLRRGTRNILESILR